ncbi:MAG: hypothetical protein HZC28_00050 [Spirochaetes bacterium]|nr:hypothetical protein [Spirochaetota bacterium]
MKHFFIIACAAASLHAGIFPVRGTKAPVVQYTYSPESTRPGFYGEITIIFDKAVLPLSDIDAMTAAYRKKLRISFEPALAGEWVSIDNRNAAYRITEAPRRSTRYTVTVNAAEMKSIKGEKVSASVSGMALTGKEFFFETPRIAVETRQTGTHLTAPFIVQFNMPVTAKMVKDHVSIKNMFGLHVIPYDIAPLIVTNIVFTNDTEVTNIITSDSGFIIQPKGLTKATRYTFAVNKDILPTGGNLGMKNDYKLDFTTYQPLKLSDESRGGFFKGRNDIPPDQPVTVRFNNDLAPQDFKAAVSITPEVKILDIVQEPHGLSVRAEFEGDTKYTMTLKNLMDVFGQVLEKQEVSFFVMSSAPWFSAPRGVMIMERNLPQILPIKVCNMEQLAIDYTFFADIAAIHGNLTNKDIAYAKTKNISSEWKRGQPYTYNFNVASVSGGASGMLLYSVRAKQKGATNWDTRTGRVFVTDIALTAKCSADETLVFARSLRDNYPLAGASVYIDGVLRGKTGWNGIARIRETNDRDPVVCVISGKDIALNFGQLFDDAYNGDDYSYEDGYGGGKDQFGKARVGVVNYAYRHAVNEILPFFFTERYLYRPGDTVEVKGIVRHRVNDSWQTKAATNELDIKVFNSRDEEITNYQLRYDDWGSMAFSISIAPDAPTGYYRIQYPVLRSFRSNEWDGNRHTQITFRVEDFKPATAEMKIIPGRYSYLWGDTFTADVLGWYLFGAPIIKPIKYAIEVESSPYESTRYPEYSFGEGYYYDEDYGGYRSQRDYSFTLADEEVTPPDDGKIRVSKPIIKAEFKGDAAITIRATTTLEDKSTVYGAKTGILVRNPVHVGLKTGSYFIDAGRNAEIGLIALGDNETIVQGQTVTLSIDRHEWKSFQQAGVNGLFGWEWREVVTSVYKKDVRVGNETFSIPMREAGFYRVRATYKVRGNERSASRWYYVLGKGDYGWRVEDGYSIDMESDKKEYQVGDTAKVLIKNPYKTALVLTSVEREKIFEARDFTANDSMIVLNIPITAEHIPNVYVSAMLFTGRTGTNKVTEEGDDPEKPRYRMGYINLPVVPREKKLSVTITPSREQYKPREEVTAIVRVKGITGTMPAEVTIAAVDKGVLNLVDYRMPDPLSHFYASRRLAVSTSEVAKLILGQRYLAEKGELIGGDGGAGFGMITPRSDFKSTAFYTHTLRLESGEGKISFKLPDNLTTFTIMAVAHTKRSEFGYGEASVTVGQPLMILPSLPRFVREGDRMQLGATVHNYTGKDAPVTVLIDADDAFGITGVRSKTVSIAQGKSAEVLFDAVVSQSRKEDLPVTIKAKTGDNADGVVEKIPLRQPDIPETVAIYEKTAGAAHHTIELSDNVRPGLSKLSMTLSPSAFTELTGSVDYLVHYPYGCLEQKSSSILPLIIGEDMIIKQEMLRDKTRADMQNVVNTILGEFPKYTTSDGFKYWPDSTDSPHPYLTVYAGFVLTMAKQKGYKVDAQLYEKAIGKVKEYANGGGRYETGWYWSVNGEEYHRWLVRAFALYVSALNGHFNNGALDEAFIRLKSGNADNISAQAYLMKAAALYPDKSKRDMVNHIASMFLSRLRTEGTQAHFDGFCKWGWFYYSDVITTAVALQALIDADVSFPDDHKVIRWLISMRKVDRWQTTHENALVFWAFSSYLMKNEKDEPSFKASVSFAGKEMMQAMFASRTAKAAAKTERIEAAPPASLALDVTKTGTGTLYYNARYQYYLKQYPPRREAGFSLSKRITDYDTGKEVVNNTYVRGKRYVAEITVHTPSDRTFAVLDDMLPAGFEAVNLDFATEGNEKKVREGSDAWWGSFFHKEKYRDRVFFSAEYLRSGTHRLTYVVRATVLGNFSVPHLKAEEMYNPSVFGYLRQADVTVVEK